MPIAKETIPSNLAKILCKPAGVDYRWQDIQAKCSFSVIGDLVQEIESINHNLLHCTYMWEVFSE